LGKQDQIWAKIAYIPKNMRSRTLMRLAVATAVHQLFFCASGRWLVDRIRRFHVEKKQFFTNIFHYQVSWGHRGKCDRMRSV